MIYLDNCATTRVLPEVAEAASQAMREGFGHPASPHALGRDAAAALAEARAAVARFIGAAPDEVFFTSGGTEANNLAVLGAAYGAGPGSHLAASAVEHSSVIDALAALEAEGYLMSLVPVSPAGVADARGVLEAAGPRTSLVSLMYVNNETGAVQPVAEAGRLLKERWPQALYHVDAVQAVGKLPVDVEALRCDLLTLSAHKLHGPKGVGALYVRSGVKLAPILFGGLRERGLRPGTENMPGIVAFQAALGLADPAEGKALEALRDRLWRGLSRGMPGLILNGPLAHGLRQAAAPHILNVAVPGLAADRLVAGLSEQGVMVSLRSACAGHPEGSHVLAAMGLPAEVRRASLRLCLSRLNTPEEMDEAADIFAAVVEELELPGGPT